jgi:hypothetical protein
LKPVDVECAYVGNAKASVNGDGNEVRDILASPLLVVPGVLSFNTAVMYDARPLDFLLSIPRLASFVHPAKLFIGERQFLFAPSVGRVTASPVLDKPGWVPQGPFVG